MKNMSQEELQVIKNMIDEALQMKNLSPEVVEQIKIFSESIRPSDGERINLVIEA